MTQKLTSLAALSLTAALMLTFPGCRSFRPANQPSTNPPQDTGTEPATEPDVTWKPVESTVDPGDLLIPMPTETEPEETTPASPTEAQVIRAQDISQSALENLMARHPGSDLVAGSLPLVHLQDQTALEEFLKEAGSQVLEDACQGYDDAFSRTTTSSSSPASPTPAPPATR